MNQILVSVGASIYVVLGIGHGVLTFRDLVAPRFFTPTDDSVRTAMNGVPIRLNRHTDLWKAWLGFNLSHSLGLIIFGGFVLVMANAQAGLLLASPGLQSGIALASACYVALSIKFWFWGPAVGSGIATCLLVAGFVV